MSRYYRIEPDAAAALKDLAHTLQAEAQGDWAKAYAAGYAAAIRQVFEQHASWVRVVGGEAPEEKPS